MSNPETTMFRCPSCGAPITMGARRGACTYCGTVVERSSNDPQSEPVVVIRRSIHVSQETSHRRSVQTTGGCGTAVGVLVMLGLLALVGLAANGVIPVGQILRSIGIDVPVPAALRSERISDLMQVVPRDAASDDLLVFLDHNDTSTLGLIDGGGQTLRWQTPPLSKNYREGAVAATDDTAYIADGTSLLAFQLGDGSLRWHSPLDVEPVSYCPGCLRVVDERVLVLQKNGTLRAFNAQTGAAVWSMRLADHTRHLTVVGGMLVVPQQIEGAPGAQLALFDIASGSLAKQLTPVCQSTAEGEAETYHSPSDPVLPLPDGSGLLAVLSWSGTCIQRWNLDADAPTWQLRIDGEATPNDWERHILLSDTQLFVASGSLLSAIDLDVGTLTTLVRDEEYQLLPLFSRGDTLVVKASPDWDSERHSLWGITVAEGERRWSYDLVSSEWFGDSGFNQWGAQLTPAGVAVVEVPEDSRELVVERLDLATGASQGRSVTSIPGSGTTTVWGNQWSDRMAWLLIDTAIYTVDLVSGTVSQQER